jgi:hypothetical protein
MKLPGGDLVAEGLADLGDAEGRLLARELERGLEVEEDALGRLGAQVDGGALLLHGADRGLEHEVERPGLGELAPAFRADQLVRVLAARLRSLAQVVFAEAPLALAEALHQRVAEAGQVPRRLPGARVLDDRRVERHDVVALLDHRLPPGVDHVVLQQDAVVAVVVGVGDAAVDLGGREDQAAALAERNDLVHGGDGLGHGGGGYSPTKNARIPGLCDAICFLRRRPGVA